jgi:hypothetical protein
MTCGALRAFDFSIMSCFAINGFNGKNLPGVRVEVNGLLEKTILI